MFKTVNKKINSLFLFKKGTNEFNASIINNNPGGIPVYSGATKNNGIIGYTNRIQYSGNFIRVITVGTAGKCSVISGEFCLAQNNGILSLKEGVKNIDLYYITLVLNNILPRLAKGDNQKSLVWKDFQDVSVSIPVLPDGTFDLESQKELATKYIDINQQKNTLLNKIEELKKTKIVIDSNTTIKYKAVPITKLFTPKGGDMKLSKPYCKEHFGKYPVYSGSTSKEIFGSIDTYAYDGDYLTWVIDGLAGYVMKLTGQFSITCHRGILIPTKECKDIDLLYVKYMIEPIFRKRARGRIGINGKNEYTALKPTHIVNYNDSILIPIDEKGNYDLKKQQDLARKYASIETIKENIYNQIYNLTNIIID